MKKRQIVQGRPSVWVQSVLREATSKLLTSAHLRLNAELFAKILNLQVPVGNWGLEPAVEDVGELLMAADYKALVPLSNLR